MQKTAILPPIHALQLDLPDPDTELMPGIRWGTIDAFPRPAYWVYQVICRRATGASLNYKLGHTLAEEVAACVLGGYGIPATVGLAAFAHLRVLGAFNGKSPSQLQLLKWLSQPMMLSGKEIQYRFAAQKSKYLAEILIKLRDAPTTESGIKLREWLRELPGIGYKTASWVTRNWLESDDVAIIDIHILRFGQAIGLFPKSYTVERDYIQLERLFLDFCRCVSIRPSELDTVIWHEMSISPRSVRHMLNEMNRNSIGDPQPKAATSNF